MNIFNATPGAFNLIYLNFVYLPKPVPPRSRNEKHPVCITRFCSERDEKIWVRDKREAVI